MKKMISKFGFVAIAILFLMAHFAFIPEGETVGYKVGDVIKDFKLKGVDGKYFSIASDLNVKGYVVVFTCNHCPFSVKYEDRIIDINRRYGSQGFPVVAINSNDKDIVPEDSYENMIVRAKEKKFSFPYLYDDTQNVAKQFGATRTPHIFIVQREKKDLVVKYIGAIDNNADNVEEVSEMYVEAALTELIAGQPVTQASTKAIGCTIKWKK
nr:thioredoxin family protein [Bacteroidota bacterium]